MSEGIQGAGSEVLGPSRGSSSAQNVVSLKCRERASTEGYLTIQPKMVGALFFDIVILQVGIVGPGSWFPATCCNLLQNLLTFDATKGLLILLA